MNQSKPPLNQPLRFGGCNTVELASEFGTPLYVVDIDAIRRRMRSYLEAGRSWPAGYHASFASKAFCCKAMCALAASEGFGLDVVSGGELATALAAGVDPGMLTLHGNNKSVSEIDQALSAQVGRIVCDSDADLRLVEERCRALGESVRVLLRVNPVVDTHTHAYVQTATSTSKFGFLLDGASLGPTVRCLQRHPQLKLAGLHVHVGSQLMDTQAHLTAIEKTFSQLARFKREYDSVSEEFNIGGGLGSSYLESDKPMEIPTFVHSILDGVRAACLSHGLPLPRLLMEPGRSLVAEAGLTLYTVGTIKEEVAGHRFVSVDGGMSDNPRPALYQAKHRAVLANRPHDPADSTVIIAGKACESGDILIRDLRIPNPVRGDILAVFTTGAYNFSMSSNYNRHCRPAVVFVSNGRAQLAVRREDHADLLMRDLMPDLS